MSCLSGRRRQLPAKLRFGQRRRQSHPWRNRKPELKMLLSKYQLVDVWRKQHPISRTFTWNSKTNTIACRLDKFYVSDNMYTWNIKSTIVTCHLSDHDAISLTINDINNSASPDRGVWKLNTKWLKENKFKRLKIRKNDYLDIAEWWDDGKAKLKQLIQHHSLARRQAEKEQRTNIMKKYQKLSAKPDSTPTETAQLDDLRTQLLDMDEQALDGSKIRSRAKALKIGDKPSRYFLKRQHRRTVKKTFKCFYKALYCERLLEQSTQDRLLNLIDRTLTAAEQAMCEGMLTKEECLTALKSCPGNKSPGLDGFPKEVFF